MRIEICGGIASGKTTLTRVLTQHLGFCSIYEDFKANPFWEAFYADPESHAFETEITFLLMHYHQLKSSLESGEIAPFVSDFSVLLDVAYADMGLTGNSHRVFESVAAEVQHRLGNPALLIHLRCDPSVELNRIVARGRPEESLVSLAFLSDLDAAVAACVGKLPQILPVITIDSVAVDFAHSPTGELHVAQAVRDVLHRR